MMSLNDTPEVRSIFCRMEIEEVATTYRIGGHVTPAKELIISSLS